MVEGDKDLTRTPEQAALKFNFNYFAVVELSINNQAHEPKLYTGIHNSYEIGENIIFPIRYMDLGPITKLGITIYDMKKDYEDCLVAGTTIDLFDDKYRLRQGTHNFYLWPGKAADLSLNTKTPALFENAKLKEINVLLRKID